MKITMLRNLARKKGQRPEDERHEGKTYAVKADEGKDLIARGLAVEGDESPDAGPSAVREEPARPAPQPKAADKGK